MKKLIKIMAILTILALSIGVLVACKEDKAVDKQYATWQTKIKDDVMLTHMIMPGSHDAGTKGMVVMAETQNHTIAEQLQAGVRYFDIRVKKSGKNLKIFHGPITGMDFSDVLGDVKNFIEQDNGQFLVLDFQHFEENPESEVAQLIKDNWQPDKYAVPQGTGANITMGEIRAKGYKYIITWGSSRELDKSYICYRNSQLYSPYYENDHKQGGEQLTGKTYDSYFDNVSNQKIFVLQGVVTATSVLQSIRSNDNKFNPYFDKYLDKIASTPELLAKANVIMRDFMVDRIEQIGKIIELNQHKGNFKL